MEMDEYQRLASTTANMDLDPEIMLASYALGLTGEAGEVADLVKKHVAHGHDLDNDKYFKELGDVLWYVAQAARVRGISLSDVAEANIEKLRKRYPEGFSTEASKARVDTEQRGTTNVSSELVDAVIKAEGTG